MEAGLDDGILLGVNAAADFMALPGGYAKLVTKAAQLQAIFRTGGSAIVARGQDVFVLHRHGADVVTAAGGALRHHRGYLEEILVNCWPGNRYFHFKLTSNLSACFSRSDSEASLIMV